MTWTSDVLAQVRTQLCRGDRSSISSVEMNEKCSWNADCQHSYKCTKQILIQSSVLEIADQDRLFHVVSDASDFAIVFAPMQYERDGA